MDNLTRRQWLTGGLAAGASLVSPHARVLGANNDIRVAVVGLNNQGTNHINWFREIPGVRVVAICDADQAVIDREEAAFKRRSETVATYRDYRELLEDKDIDAVVTATPNHWHALATVWACQAGKDVYVEKPVSHNLREGRRMVEAARTYDRIVQSGTQRRSDPGLREALAWIREGHLGKIELVRGIVYVRRDSIGNVDGPQPVPATVDYNLWCGPALQTPLKRKRLHYDWHWFWETGNGDFGNNGIHFVDICRWAIGQDKLPRRVVSFGGRFGYEDDGETPNTQLVYFDYEPVPVLFEIRGLPKVAGGSGMDDYLGTRAGTVVHCEGGHFLGGWAYDIDGKKIRQFKRTGGSGHQSNFIDALRSRKPSDLTADILDGHLSSALCHMGSISHRLGEGRSPEEIRERIRDWAPLDESFGRVQEHLLANGVDLAGTPGCLGPCLEMDPDTERFVGDLSGDANRLLTREYRAPFVVPEKV